MPRNILREFSSEQFRNVKEKCIFNSLHFAMNIAAISNYIEGFS